ncbi:MAG: ABC transporter ATP-binding protein [Niabella sp.]|nr:ABC transporter ATP-binding protein [Niabella sp.]
MSDMKDPVIELHKLTKCYGKLKAVNELSLQIPKGEVFGLLGPNGAGKSTTILMMLGLTEPTSGSATVLGFNATKNPIDVKRKVGYMPDSVGFYNQLTALENLLYTGRLNNIPAGQLQQRALETLSLVGLEAVIHKKAGTFSRGMKQRLGLAEVLIKEPEIIILDEPTLGIDPSGVKEFLLLIRQQSRQQGLTVLLSSHHLHQVQQVCDRVGIFVGGKLLAAGSIDTLSHNLFASDPFLVEVELDRTVTDTEALMSVLKEVPFVKKIQATGQQLALSCAQDVTADIVRQLVLNNYAVTGVHKKRYDLDEIYQRYFEDNLKEQFSNEKSSGFFHRSFFRKRSRQ